MIYVRCVIGIIHYTWKPLLIYMVNVIMIYVRYVIGIIHDLRNVRKTSLNGDWCLHWLVNLFLPITIVYKNYYSYTHGQCNVRKTIIHIYMVNAMWGRSSCLVLGADTGWLKCFCLSLIDIKAMGNDDMVNVIMIYVCYVIGIICMLCIGIIHGLCNVRKTYLTGAWCLHWLVNQFMFIIIVYKKLLFIYTWSMQYEEDLPVWCLVLTLVG